MSKVVQKIEGKAAEVFGSWRKYEVAVKGYVTNAMKNQFKSNFEKLNKMLEPLGLELSVVERE